MGHDSAGEITQLLQGWRDGDRKALDALVPIVYNELHRIAHFQLRQERPDHTLQSAALARRHRARKRGGGEEMLSPEDTTLLVSEKTKKEVDVVALDDALNAPAGIDCPQGAGCGIALFRRIEFRRDSGSAQSVGSHRGARREHGTSLAAPRDES